MGGPAEEPFRVLASRWAADASRAASARQKPKLIPRQFMSALPRQGMRAKSRGPIRSVFRPKSAEDFNAPAARDIDPDQQVSRAPR
jgi:hypothetical protein